MLSDRDNVNQPNDISALPPMPPESPACPLPVQKSLSAPSPATIGSSHDLRPCKEIKQKAFYIGQDLKQVIRN
jgi:hypothetical protein